MALLEHFKKYFSITYTTFLLILLIELTQRMQIYLYHARLPEVLALQAFIACLLLAIAALLSIILSLAEKTLGKNGFILYTLSEFACLIIFSFSYAYTLLSLDKSLSLLRNLWSTGIVPAGTTVTLLYLYLKQAERMRSMITVLLSRLAKLTFLIALVSSLSVAVSFGKYFLSKKDCINGTAPAELLKASISPPNVIIITFDALTAKDMSLYGYSRPTTPYLQEFAKKAFVFDNMYSNFVSTTPTLISLFTSKYPWTHNIYVPGTYLKEGRSESLFSMLPEYATIAITAADSANPMLIGLGAENLEIKSSFPSSHLLGKMDALLYNVFHNTIPFNELPLFSKISPPRESDRLFITQAPEGKEGGYIVDSKITLDDAFKEIKKVSGKPFFIWIHIFAPNIHVAHPHVTDPPEPFLHAFTKENTSISKDVWINDRYPENLQPEVDKLRARYDECILYADHCLEDFMRKLEQTRLFDNSLIIITSDHGESFEKGWRGHFSASLYNASTNVPLLIHLPWQEKGRRLHTAAESVDIAPTLLEILGKKIPSWMQGESLMPYIRNEGKMSLKPKFSYWRFDETRRFMASRKERVISVIQGGNKLIYNLMNGSTELYDMNNDKDETNDLYRRKPETAEKLKRFIPQELF